jgi:hypothetical protein
MRFGWKGRLFQFLVLPFGLSPAPKVFTSNTRVIKAILGAKGIRTIFYLDDILVIRSSFTICMEHTQKTLQLLVRAGFLIHKRKSSLTPSMSFLFLGFHWDTLGASLSIPQSKLDTLHAQAKILLGLMSPSSRQVMVLTGLIAAFCKAVPLLQLKGRWLQIDLNQVYETERDLLKTVTLG